MKILPIYLTIIDVLNITSEDSLPPVNKKIIGPGICQFCHQPAPHLKEDQRTAKSYCRKCAPGRETDSDWPKD